MKKLLNKHSVFILTFPYVILFILFIVLPVAASVFLSFTQFNTIEFPKWIGLKNYMQLFTNDQIFMQKVLPNTIVYSLFVGHRRLYSRLFSGMVLSTGNKAGTNDTYGNYLFPVNDGRRIADYSMGSNIQRRQKRVSELCFDKAEYYRAADSVAAIRQVFIAYYDTCSFMEQHGRRLSCNTFRHFKR